MTIYTVLAPPPKAGSDEPDPDGFVFVKEGFCWPALYITAPWLIWRRMWLVLVVYILASIAVIAFANRMPLPVAWSILVLFGVLVALEANNLRRWTLERRRYRFLGVASGDRASEAEFSFFANWLGSPAPQPSAKPTNPIVSRPMVEGEIIGLFPSPGGSR